MRALLLTPLVIASLFSAVAAQKPKPSLASKLKGAVRTAADSSATRAAAAVVDSVLGTGATRLGEGVCPPGMAPVGATVGTAVVGKLKEELRSGPDSARRVAANCAVDSLAQLQQSALEAAQLQSQLEAPGAPAGQPSAAKTAMGAMAAATPVGLAVGAAPVAAKALGGLLGRGQTRESMIKDLSRGRLELKAVRFIGASDALEGEVSDDFTALAEALQTIEGDFVLNLPAELNDEAELDTVMVRRRLAKLAAHLAVAGLGERLEMISGPPGLDPKRKAPKIGGARVEILRRPAPAGSER